MKSTIKLDIGFWMPRTYRGNILADKLLSKGHKVMIYHFNPMPIEQKHAQQINYGLNPRTSFTEELHRHICSYINWIPRFSKSGATPA